MAERVELPRLPAGEPEAQLQELYNYLYRMAETLNANLAEIGTADLTDAERDVLNSLAPEGQASGPAMSAISEAETLKSLIIKTASWVKNTLDSYRINMLGEYVAEGKFGKYVRNTRMDVDVTPTGTTQNFKFSEIIEDLKRYEVNAKNYIKTGLLRMESSLPVYGIAVGKDVVTFSQDGTETYHDENKVAEFTADALSFYNNGVITARYAGTKTSFYSGGTEIMYIQGGEIYALGDLKLGSGKKIQIGKYEIDQYGLLYKQEYSSPVVSTGHYIGEITDVPTDRYLTGIEFFENVGTLGGSVSYDGSIYLFSYDKGLQKEISIPINFSTRSNQIVINGTFGGQTRLDIYANQIIPNNVSGVTNKLGSNVLGTGQWWTDAYISNVYYSNLIQGSSRDIKHGIEDMETQGERLDSLRPVTFIYDDDPDEKRRYGLIYEDTIDTMPEICTEDESEKGIKYMELIPMLLKEIQDLRRRVQQLENERS